MNNVKAPNGMTKQEMLKQLNKEIRRWERLQLKLESIKADITATVGGIEFWKKQIETTED